MSGGRKTGEPGSGHDDAPPATTPQRLDKWLWYTRLIKTRTMATKLVAEGKVRVNRIKCGKPSQLVHVDDVITAAIGKHVRVLKVLAPGSRRGPAIEAQALYEDLAPIVRQKREGVDPLAPAAPAQREPGSGRPTKQDRRRLDRLRSGDA